MFIFALMYNHKYLKKTRKDLRNNSTSAEAFLWKYLSKRKLHGRKFRRQQSLENFIVDFYYPSERLIIELDGHYHDNPKTIEKDRTRDTNLQQLGFKVLRFENKLVFDNLTTVLKTISEHFNSKKSSPPSQGGE